MSEIVVRNVDDAVVAQLETRARQNGRSFQGELKIALEQAPRTGSAPLSGAEYRGIADQIHASLADRPQSDSAALLAEDRAQ